MKICIDAGHGGTDPGAVYNKRQEKDDNLRLARKVKELLEAQGATVYLPDDADIEGANKKNCDYFLSLHRDACNDYKANGATIYVYSKASNAAVDKATKIYNAVIKASGFKARGVKKGAANYDDYAVCRDTKMPAALLELGFITNKADNKIFDDKFDYIAIAITSSLCEIFNITTNYPTISLGSKGTYVKLAQKALRKSVNPWLGIDGDFGEKTDSATRTFQKKYGLTVDGVIGPKTWAALKSFL